MKLHSDILNRSDIQDALRTAKTFGTVASHVTFHIFEERGSRTRRNAYEIQLGTDLKVSSDKRHYKTTDSDGTTIYAASYDEWGWFIKELYKIDPDLVFGHYKTRDGFLRMTDYKYV